MSDRLPTHAELPKVWNDIAVDLARRGHFAAGCAAMRRAVDLDPSSADLHSNYGNMLRRHGLPLDADREVAEAVRLDPGHAPALSNAACVLLDALEPDKAVTLFDAALATEPANPDWLYGRACALLMAGRWKEGFAAHECRLAGRGYETAKIPLWDGRPFKGRLMVHAEQGLGDTIMFSRFVLPLLRVLSDNDIGAHIVLPQQLHSLFADRSRLLVAFHRAGEEVEAEAHIPLMSLPAVLKVEEIDGRAYLSRPGYKMGLDAAPGTKHKIGLVWRAKANWKQQTPDELHHGRMKSMPLEVLLELTRIRGAQLFGLQVPTTDVEDLGAGHLVKDLQVHIHDFADLAAFASRMDVVVSVDTAPAHLAAALGVPTVVCLHHAGSWQWQTGSRSAWYDSVRIVRQDQPGVWPVDAIVEAVREAL